MANINLSTSQVAMALNVSGRTVVRMCEEGELSGAFRVGRLWRVPEYALQEYITRHTAYPSARE